MSNPWETGTDYDGHRPAYCSTDDRLSRVQTMTPAELVAARDWPDTQKTVRAKIERRLRKICDVLPPVLDACCGPRMMWFDKADGRALFVDKRREICVADTREGRREIVVDPDQIADFRELPFPDATFALVVFDPPHTFAGPNGWTRKKYGTLEAGWRDDLRHGFEECFRVLCPLGTLVFKWCEHQVPVSIVLALTPERPLFGQRCGTTAKTHWIVFMKQNTPVEGKL